MTNYTMSGNPGTPPSASAQAAAAARRRTGLRWSTVGSCTPRWFDHGLLGASAGSVFVKTAELGAVAGGQGYVRVITDLPTIKQFRVPLSLRERSP
jgi:hypothetical protein